MQIVTAVENLLDSYKRPYVFLAGGITNCPGWQDVVIEELKDDQFKGTLLNPRRKNFDIHDPNASREQITWEFKAIEKSFIFTIWFCESISDQPICFYELGRNVPIFSEISGYIMNHLCIGVDPKFKRKQDVYIQLELINPNLVDIISTSLEDHIENIKKAVNSQWKKG